MEDAREHRDNIKEQLEKNEKVLIEAQAAAVKFYPKTAISVVLVKVSMCESEAAAAANRESETVTMTRTQFEKSHRQ